MMPSQILIVDDEPNIRRMLAGVLEDEGYAVLVAADAAAAKEQLAAHGPDLLLLDLMLPGTDGLALMEQLSAAARLPPVIMMSGQGSIEVALRATRMGAHDFIEKPIEPGRLLLSIEHALKLERLREENADLKQALEIGHEIIGASAPIRAMREAIARAAPSNARVLITGEHGTGKELVARALHAGSRRADRPFITVNCAAIPAELLESELFGHEKGAFTGAHARRRGKFERAQGGTLLLDEIGDMNPTTQAKLLRVLEEGEMERVGGEQPITLDLRLLASTNRDLPDLMAEGRFRPDLYHRLKVVPIHVPPLRERAEDVPGLVEHYLRHFCASNGWPSCRVEPESLRLLSTYAWPGNVRELRNLMERLVILGRGETLRATALRPLLGGETTSPLPARATLAEHLEAQEKGLISRALIEAEGNIAAAARALGVDRANLHRRLRRLGLRS